MVSKSTSTAKSDPVEGDKPLQTTANPEAAKEVQAAQASEDSSAAQTTAEGRFANVDTNPASATVVSATDTVAASAYDVVEGEQMVTLKEDVLEEFFYPDTKRPSYRLLFTKGSTVKKSQIDAINERAKAAAKA